MQKPSKNIAIDLLYMSHITISGTFIYTLNLLENLFRLDDHHTYYLFVKQNDYQYFRKKYAHYSRVQYVVIDIRKDIFTHPLRAWNKLTAKFHNKPNEVERLVLHEIQTYIDTHHINIFFSPSQVIYPEGLQRVAMITTIYDLQQDFIPENFSPSQLKLRQHGIRYAVEHSTYILSISEYTKETICQIYNTIPDKIIVTYLAPNIPKETEVVPLPKQFLFYPAALWPHKNQKILIEALNALQSKFPDLHLVLTGSIKNETFKSELENLISERYLKAKVHMLGFVSSEKLAYIYTHATALVFPSSFEGFGMPIVEAFYYGVPVIAARNSSITEIVSDAGLLFETGNTDELISCVERVLTTPTLRTELVHKGTDRLRAFSWQASALKTLALFNTV